MKEVSLKTKDNREEIVEFLQKENELLEVENKILQYYIETLHRRIESLKQNNDVIRDKNDTIRENSELSKLNNDVIRTNIDSGAQKKRIILKSNDYIRDENDYIKKDNDHKKEIKEVRKFRNDTKSAKNDTISISNDIRLLNKPSDISENDHRESNNDVINENILPGIDKNDVIEPDISVEEEQHNNTTDDFDVKESKNDHEGVNKYYERPNPDTIKPQNDVIRTENDVIKSRNDFLLYNSETKTIIRENLKCVFHKKYNEKVYERISYEIYWIIRKKRFSLEEFIKASGYSKPTVVRDIKVFKRKGWMKYIGTRKYGYYVFNPEIRKMEERKEAVSR